MKWFNVLKLDRAKLRQKGRDIKDALQTSRGMRLSNEDRKLFQDSMEADLMAEEQDHIDSRRDKRKKMGLRTTQQDRIMGTAGTPRDKRVHRMKPEDRPKPRRRATEEELRELTRRNKPPKMGSKGSGFRGQ